MRLKSWISLFIIVVVFVTYCLVSEKKIELKVEPTIKGSFANKSVFNDEFMVRKQSGSTSKGKFESFKNENKKWSVEEYSQSEKFERYALGPKVLRPYFKIKQKAIPTEQDKIDLGNLLSDDEIISKSFNIIKTIDSKYSEYQEKDRIMAIKFIGQAMSWKDNPQRSFVLQGVSDYLSNNHTPKGAGLRTKKSVAGDRIELFLTLFDQDEYRAGEVLRQIAGTKSEKLFRYAIETYRKKRT